MKKEKYIYDGKENMKITGIHILKIRNGNDELYKLLKI